MQQGASSNGKKKQHNNNNDQRNPSSPSNNNKSSKARTNNNSNNSNGAKPQNIYENGGGLNKKGREIRGRGKRNDNVEGAENRETKPKEIYIPPSPSMDEKEIFSQGVMPGINFEDYDKIPIKVMHIIFISKNHVFFQKILLYFR